RRSVQHDDVGQHGARIRVQPKLLRWNVLLSRGVTVAMNPGHTITITPSDVHVVVKVDGAVVAESDRPVLLDETGLPTRYYLPREDVRMDLFRPTTFPTECPFKGQAS